MTGLIYIWRYNLPKDKYSALREFISLHPDQCGIVYCLTRKLVEEVSMKLVRDGFSVTRYHAGLGDYERQKNQDDFIYDRAQIMIATNAFGMGIDKSNVRFVIHYNMPKSIEAYYQEIGRCSRDGEPWAYAFFIMVDRMSLPISYLWIITRKIRNLIMKQGRLFWNGIENVFAK